ncbi:MAG: hypothetical protein LKJ50_10575 [Clostridiales bacterium]|nr:hypothetical protein [Clostridiales bacterium]MCI1962363.1 hypothetical protein [Clostridiales bacterium]MCI2022825.1 hypothetical protein [Clostridiales bacterium]MCI2027222.1 hypothetical protein [Clostridiales bacterium]
MLLIDTIEVAEIFFHLSFLHPDAVAVNNSGSDPSHRDGKQWTETKGNAQKGENASSVGWMAQKLRRTVFHNRVEVVFKAAFHFNLGNPTTESLHSNK